MFEYSVKLTAVSPEKINGISEVVDEKTMNDAEMMGLLEEYDSPFWFVYATRDEIRLEIHADMSDTDIEWVKHRFDSIVAETMKERL